MHSQEASSHSGASEAFLRQWEILLRKSPKKKDSKESLLVKEITQSFISLNMLSSAEKMENSVFCLIPRACPPLRQPLLSHNLSDGSGT